MIAARLFRAGQLQIVGSIRKSGCQALHGFWDFLLVQKYFVSDIGIQESSMTEKMKMSQCQCPIPTGERQVDQDAADNISVQPCGGSCT